MNIFNNFIFALVLIIGVSCTHAETNPSVELGQMMKRMYSYSTNEFEYGENPATGRLDAIRNCTMLRSYFDEPMLKQAKESKKCEFAYSRFPPDAAGTPVEQLVRENDDVPPIPFVQSIKVSRDQADIDILFGAANAPKGKLPDAHKNQGRVIFYLKKLPQGWRIVNKLEFRRWPLKLDGESSDCRFASLSYHFALEPRTAAELSWLPPACQKLAAQTLPK